MTTISDALYLARQHHESGRLHEAELIYRQILAAHPHQPDAWHLLGVIAHQVGNHEIAVEYILRAISLNGANENFFNNLGAAYGALGKTAEAAVNYQRAIQLKPDFAEAHNNWGVQLADQEKLDEAIKCYLRALQLKATYVDAYNNLGTVLKKQGKVPEAVACYKRALELQPDHVGAQSNLGIVELEQGHAEAAFDCFWRAIQQKPDFAEAHNNFGNVLKDQRRLDEAIASYRTAIRLKPDFAEAHNNLGNVLLDQGKLDEAVACYDRAFQSKPTYSTALVSQIHGLQHLCQWERLLELSQRAIDIVDDPHLVDKNVSVSPFSFIGIPTPTNCEQQLRCARQWVNRQLASTVEQGNRLGLIRTRLATAKPRLTIGYLSADFHAHATAYLIAELFEKHDREQFTVIGYSYGPDDGSSMRRRLKTSVDHFVELQRASFMEAAQRIAADDVDILVDLKGYTINSRSQILALRPAPIQVNYLGYPGTMGASFMDYILVDDFIVPPEQQPFFTEQLVYLPGCYQVNDGQREIASSTPSRAECGLPDEGFVFCNFNHNYKITPAMFEIWMDLLKSVSGSVLWLLAGNRFAPANLRREAEARGVASERLVFAPHLPLAAHLARYRLADLFLDTFPVNAHTTASDSLWAGCPVLTLAGETFVSRAAGSLLRTIGLPELITTNFEEYRNLALRLAQDPAQLAELRDRLQVNRQTSSLFDSTAFARNLEHAYRTMWERHCSGREPTAFRVSPF